jgi:endo-1,4-beta-xylanase
LQKRSSIKPARYLVAALAALALVFVFAGGEDDVPPGPIPVDSESIRPNVYVKPLGAAVEVAHALQDKAYRARLITTFTSITPENAMKWAIVEPEPGEFDFDQADRLVRFARLTNKRVRGHPLVWDYQLPGWVDEEEWTARELRQVMRRHIRTLMLRYRGRIAEWDVVNEPLATDGTLERNIWQRTLGPGWIAYAFQVAHRVDPKAKLFLNELDAERGTRARALLALARQLKRHGVPIGGVGFEYHTNGEDALSSGELRRLFRAVERMGLSVAITELDVRDTDERRQARIYGDAARACAAASNCTGVTVWGVTDRWSWLGSDSAPLPFGEDGEPKPALRTLTTPFLKGVRPPLEKR